MEYNFSTVFKNSLLQSEIFSFLNSKNLGKARFVCLKWAEAGESILKKRNRYFALNSMIEGDKKILPEFNWMNLNWMKVCLNERSKFWLLNSVEFPIRDILEYKDIRDFFSKHGQLIKNLRLTKRQVFPEHLNGISENCPSPMHLIHLILTSWCLNLTSLSIIETPKTILWGEHLISFPQFDLQQPYFSRKLKLESLALEFSNTISLLGHSFPDSYIQEIYRNSPNLKNIGVKWLKVIDEIYLPINQKRGFYELKLLEDAMQYEDAQYLRSFTVQDFPKLKNIKLAISFKGDNAEDFIGLLDHQGVTNLTITTGTIIFKSKVCDLDDCQYYGIIFKMTPHVKAIKIVDGFKYLHKNPVENPFNVLPNAYPNIEKLEVEERRGKNIFNTVHILGTACPNLKLFKMHLFAKKEEEERIRIKAIVQKIRDTMKKLRHFELAFCGPLWNDGDWEEFRGQLNVILDGRYLRFYFGSDDYLKTRNRFD